MSVAVVIAGLMIAAPLSAQSVEQNDQPLVVTVSLEQQQELQRWTHDFLEWQKSVDKWLNLSKQGSWSHFLEQHKKPDPPEWLAGACPLLANDKDFAEACTMLGQWSDDDPFSARSRKAVAAAVAQKEHPSNSVWWRHVHLDGLWSTTQSNIAALGLFGTHLTAEVEGRMQIFVAPGVLLVSVPTIYGTRDVKAATDWGITYRLFDAGQHTVHFNLVHAWLLGKDQRMLNSQMTLAGFSLSFRPKQK